jgi:hypothetical protein
MSGRPAEKKKEGGEWQAEQCAAHETFPLSNENTATKHKSFGVAGNDRK